MTRDESLEAALLVQAVALMVVSLLLARFAHAGLARAWPALKPPVAPGEYAHLLVVFLPVWVFAAERLGIHRVRLVTGPRTELARRVILTQAWGVAAIALILVAAQTSLNRSLIAIFFTISTVALLAVAPWQRRWIARRRGESLVLVLGDLAGAAAEIEVERGRKLERFQPSAPEEIDARLRAGPVDELILVGPRRPEDTRAILDLAGEAGIPVLVPLAQGVDGTGLPSPRVEAVGRAQYLVYQRHRPHLAGLIAKTMLDRVLAAALLVALAPLFLTLGLLVRVLVGRPAFFRQRRGGLYGRPFTMLKFRTMRLGAEAERATLLARNEMDGPVFKLADDPRVTRFGRLLRRTSLDELPQLLNVLAGQMSLVGPRPLPVGETQELQGGHRRRLSMRPGLTCLWQVSGRNDLSFGEWMALDLRYVDKWSLGLDLAILLRTIPAIVSGRGAR